MPASAETSCRLEDLGVTEPLNERRHAKESTLPWPYLYPPRERSVNGVNRERGTSGRHCRSSPSLTAMQGLEEGPTMGEGWQSILE